MPRAKATHDQEQALYQKWVADPTPENLESVVKALQPQINQAAQMYLGRNDPILQSRAKILLIKALPRYDPSQGTLRTFATQQLLALIREGRQLAQPLRLPERQSLLRGQLYLVEREMEDELQRPPSDAELADRTGLSLKQIARIRQLSGHMVESQLGASGGNDGGGGGEWTPSARQTPVDWAEVVYHDLAPRDQKILEWTLGLHGSPKLSNNEIAQRLGVSPSLVSQRKAAIQKHFDTLQRLPL